MPGQNKNSLLKSSVVEATASNILKKQISSMLLDLRRKGRHADDRDGMYLMAAAACYEDSYLSTGIFSDDKGVLG
tara:strand:+ start:200 stop:424 length:225 start_codon:yes stop_codon:yes gene_type:complete